MSDELLDEALRALRQGEEMANDEAGSDDEATLVRILATLESDPLLDAGIEILRAEDAATHDATSPATLARIQRSLARRDEPAAPLRARTSWRTMSAAAALIVVCLAGAPSAWAWAVEWVQRFESAPPDPTPRSEERPVARTRAIDRPEPIAAPLEAPVATLGESSASPPSAGREPAPIHAVVRSPRPTPEPVAAPEPSVVRIADPLPSAPSVEDLAEQASFEQAHRLHFQSGDPLAALDGWDAYLASYPRGRFQQEARYNRAITLVRLGRADEAQRALTPFADGQFGGYRQTEARRLIDALDPLRGPRAEEMP